MIVPKICLTSPITKLFFLKNEAMYQLLIIKAKDYGVIT